MTGRERAAAFGFVCSTVASIVLAVVYWQGGQTQLEGVCLFVITGGIGFGIVSWAKQATPHDEVTEERHSVASSDESFEEVSAEIEGSAHLVSRRRMLIGLAGSAFAAMSAALLFPLRSLGPRPGKDLKSTPYAAGGLRVVTEDGVPVNPKDLPVDGVVTVWPEGHTHAADAPTLLIHTRPDQGFTPRRGREDWTVDGIVAYSKLCTHVGCPVGLYQAESGLLLCPCHQSTFNVLDGARPIFGPAARSLPQLPLSVDSEGNLVARGDFSDPVGPGFWDRGR
ncbi:MAG: ubiquinol-cytochrome c reductase iron-sulfur subunit [Acidimicrobiaceae bacterium]